MTFCRSGNFELSPLTKNGGAKGILLSFLRPAVSASGLGLAAVVIATGLAAAQEMRDTSSPVTAVGYRGGVTLDLAIQTAAEPQQLGKTVETAASGQGAKTKSARPKKSSGKAKVGPKRRPSAAPKKSGPASVNLKPSRRPATVLKAQSEKEPKAAKPSPAGTPPRSAPAAPPPPSAAETTAASEAPAPISEEVAKPAAEAVVTEPAPMVLPARDAVPVKYKRGKSRKDYTLVFDWPVPVSAAVYRRGGYVWFVFDRVERLDLEPARNAGGKAMASLQQIPLPLGTAARIKIETGSHPSVERKGNRWMVKMTQKASFPIQEMKVLAQPRALIEPRVLVPARGAHDPLVMITESLSETVFVVPVRGSGVGVGSDRVFPEFRMIATAQGIVVRSRADGITVRRVREGIEITSQNGLVLSGRDPPRKDVRWPGDETASPRIIDVVAWRRMGHGFLATKKKLQAEIALSSESERGRHRLALAQYYFANGFYSDALGTLTLAKTEDKIGDEPAFSLFLGATALMVKDLKQAGQALLDPTLNDLPEAMLWRAALKAAQLDWATSTQLFKAGRGLLRFYQEPFRSDLSLIAARTHLKAGDPDEAMRYLDLLNSGKPSPAQKYQGDYLRGVALRARGELNAALVQWEKVAREAEPPTRVEAMVSRTDVLLELHKITRVEAITELENLRFAWRGDDVEFQMLRRLADLYFEEKLYRLMLTNLRRAAEFYPKHPDAGVLKRKLRTLFLLLFYEGEADELPPVAALAIYDEFRELTPTDSRGDVIIGRLAERLVSVDLLQSAGKLLATQMRKRGPDPVKAQIGARLAAVRLLDRKPKEAIKALDKSKSPILPEDLAMERNRLRARALSDLGQLDEAIDVIGADPGSETDLVRAAIYWRMSNWPGAAKALGRVASQIKVEEGRLSESDSKLVLSWATALALSGDKQGIVVLRRRFDHLMDAGPYRDAYRVVADDLDERIADYPALVAKVREVAHYEGFMSDYRDRLKAAGTAKALTTATQ